MCRRSICTTSLFPTPTPSTRPRSTKPGSAGTAAIKPTARPRTDGDWAKQLGIPNASPDILPGYPQHAAAAAITTSGPGGFSERRGASFTFQENLTKIVCEAHHEVRLRGGPHHLRLAGRDIPFRPICHGRHGLSVPAEHRQRIREFPAWDGLRAPRLRRRRRTGSRAGGRTRSMSRTTTSPPAT